MAGEAGRQMKDFFELSIEEQASALAALLERLAATECRSLNDVALDMGASRQAAWDRTMADAGLPACRVPDRLLSL